MRVINPNALKSYASAGMRSIYSFLPKRQTGRKVILCFHSIKPHATHSTIHPESFDRILSWLKSNTDVMDIDSLLSIERTSDMRPAVALTFDDGHKDNLIHALPIAQNYGITFTVFITAGVVEQEPRAMLRFKHVLRQDIADFEVLTWDDACRLIEGGCSIGSHTWDHPMLSHLPVEGIRFQLEVSRDLIRERLGLQQFGIAYPYGKFGRNVDKRVFALAEEAGYSHGLCVEHRALSPDDNRFQLPRFIVNSGDLESLRRKVTGEEDYHGFISRHMPQFFARLLSPTDFSEAMGALSPQIDNLSVRI
jgi:peptidoglycan/xylan/chitin deacetylase (PgdA/CDA1 family)